MGGSEASNLWGILSCFTCISVKTEDNLLQQLLKFPSHPSLLVSWLLHGVRLLRRRLTFHLHPDYDDPCFSPGRLSELRPGTGCFQETVRQLRSFQCDSHQAWSHRRRGSGLLGLNNSFNYVFPWLPASSLKDEQSFISGSKGQLQFIPEGLRRCPEGETIFLILNWHIRVASIVLLFVVTRLISCMMVRLSWVVLGGIHSDLALVEFLIVQHFTSLLTTFI